VDQDHERRGAAVEHRDLGAVHLHPRVIDAERPQGRQQVLHRVDRHPVARQRRRVVEPGQVLEGGGDLDADIGADEANAVLGGGRLQVEPDRLPRVETDPGAADGSLECSALAHGVVSVLAPEESKVHTGTPRHPVRGFQRT
jgi:hypothetical protein